MTGNQFWNFAKGIVRAIIRILVETVHRLLINLFDTLFGFLKWPVKKLRLKIFILPDEQKTGIIAPSDVDKTIFYTKDIFKKNFNVEVVPVRSNEFFVEILETTSPYEALYTRGSTGALIEEFKIAGNFYASNLRAPIYPVTAFVVIDIKGAIGCSLGPMTDYITLDHSAAIDGSVLAHELAHACGLWHLSDKENLLWNRKNRGDKTTWWQKNILRGSRHVTYW